LGKSDRAVYLGGEAFTQRMAVLAEDKAEALEVPRAQRRPRTQLLSHFVNAYAQLQEGMVRADGTGDYTLAEVVQAFGVHNSTMSRAVSGERLGQGLAGPGAADRRTNQ
jgi:putative transposase